MKRPLLATLGLVLGGMSVGGSARADELKATTGTPLGAPEQPEELE